MRHRIIGNVNFGLGNSSPEEFDNVIPENKSEKFKETFKAMCMEAIELFPVLKELEGCDFKITNKYIAIGYEPAYMYEPYFCLLFDLGSKMNSYNKRGKANGAYGSDIKLITNKYYKDYKNKSVFTNFIDKWYDKLKRC